MLFAVLPSCCSLACCWLPWPGKSLSRNTRRKTQVQGSVGNLICLPHSTDLPQRLHWLNPTVGSAMRTGCIIKVRTSMHGLSNSVEALLPHCLLALTFHSCSVLACFTFPFMCLQFCWIVYLLAKHTVPAADLAAVVKQQQKQKAATPVYGDLIRRTHCLPY